jgi:hypothetical protein
MDKVITPVLLRCMATNSSMASVGCIATNSKEARFSIWPSQCYIKKGRQYTELVLVRRPPKLVYVSRSLKLVLVRRPSDLVLFRRPPKLVYVS